MTKARHKQIAIFLYVASFVLATTASTLPVFFGITIFVLALLLGVLSVVLLAGGSYFLGASWEIKIGHCLNCDYNLTGNMSGICPECGTEAKR